MNWENDLISFRRVEAADNLEFAKMLLEIKYLFSSVNRIYFSIFYEVSALLMTQNLASDKHSGTIALFNKHFIKPGIIDKNIGLFFVEMFNFWQEGNYDELVQFDEHDVETWYQKARTCLDVLEKQIDRELLRPVN